MAQPWGGGFLVLSDGSRVNATTGLIVDGYFLLFFIPSLPTLTGINKFWRCNPKLHSNSNSRQSGLIQT